MFVHTWPRICKIDDEAAMRVRAQASGGETGFPMPGGPIDGPSAWHGPELARSDAWMYSLSDADMESLAEGLKEINVL